MSWILILSMAVIVFLNRFILLEPKVKLKLPNYIVRMLNYAAPCLFTAMCLQIIWVQESKVIPAYIYGGLSCLLFSLILRYTLVNVCCSLMMFYCFINII